MNPGIDPTTDTLLKVAAAKYIFFDGKKGTERFNSLMCTVVMLAILAAMIVLGVLVFWALGTCLPQARRNFASTDGRLWWHRRAGFAFRCLVTLLGIPYLTFLGVFFTSVFLPVEWTGGEFPWTVWLWLLPLSFSFWFFVQSVAHRSFCLAVKSAPTRAWPLTDDDARYMGFQDACDHAGYAYLHLLRGDANLAKELAGRGFSGNDVARWLGYRDDVERVTQQVRTVACNSLDMLPKFKEIKPACGQDFASCESAKRDRELEAEAHLSEVTR